VRHLIGTGALSEIHSPYDVFNNRWPGLLVELIWVTWLQT